MSRLKGSRRGPYPGSLQRYMEHQEEIRVCSKCGYHTCECGKIKVTDNIQNDFKKDLREFIAKIEAGKYGNPENWKKLRDDLVSLYKKSNKANPPDPRKPAGGLSKR